MWRRRRGQRLVESVGTRVEREDAERWVAEEIARQRAQGYADLLPSESDAVHEELRSRSGRVLVRQTDVFWDGEPPNLRVIVDVWDPDHPFFRSIVRDSFIRAPDGSFVGE